jgi:DNA-binding Xre family transcriptional regulator
LVLVVIYYNRRVKDNVVKNYHMEIRSAIREIMELKGVTVRGLADLTGLSTRTVMFARGPQILQCRLETLVAIATALGVRVKDLFEEE